MEEWEEPLHPGSLPANLSHFPPQRNPNCTFFPTYPFQGLINGKMRRQKVFPGLRPSVRAIDPMSASHRALPQSATLLADRALRLSPSLHPLDSRDNSARPPSIQRSRPPDPQVLARASAEALRSLMSNSLRPRRRAAAAHSRPRARNRRALAAGSRRPASSPGSSADPASVVPASAPNLYAGAVRAPPPSARRRPARPPPDETTRPTQPDLLRAPRPALQAPGSPPPVLTL